MEAWEDIEAKSGKVRRKKKIKYKRRMKRNKDTNRHVREWVLQLKCINPFMPTGAFNICCPRDCVFRHNGGTSGAPLKPLRVDSALRALSTLRGSRGASEVPPLCQETSVSRTANVGTWLRKRNGGQKWVKASYRRTSNCIAQAIHRMRSFKNVSYSQKLPWFFPSNIRKYLDNHV